ncbi:MULTISPECIES: SMP-30/gluconolactonase/LRE family protein [Meridianimarinicoccus]|uniref:SMP-30/gluconolactonase/LRE family protein n=1 Tax=Meridianimarinicoccus zhengii TaxID=2056810 RepID=UPI000DAC17F1|nr:SMP-30/gluconolactonase/LRE family protein [Phycocomes zhengii]
MTMTDSIATVFDATPCSLGEGALWHPERGQFYWFDINAGALMTRTDGETRRHAFGETVSAAGWVDRDTLLMASASGLDRLDLRDMTRARVVALEADNPVTRSNDGRADPWGGFWIGTMGRKAEPGAGAIYRFHGGKLEMLVGGITIPNAICFAPDRSCAYWCDTAEGIIWRQPLDAESGWPEGGRAPFVDARGESWGPDGAVVDAAGCLWNAQWGGGRVARYDTSGALIATWDLPTAQPTCPAFGGAELDRLFVTTAAEGIADDPAAGLTYAIDAGVTGLPEHRVIL